MVEAEFSPARLEAISDGVIAVAITIMVLELHPPRDPTPAALVALWPQFASYAVWFGFVAMGWVNHRYMFRFLKRVNERVLGFASAAQYEPAARPIAFKRRVVVVNAASLAVCALAIPAAFVSPILSLAMNFAMTLLYMTPLQRPG